MRKLLLPFHLLIAFAFGAYAQGDSYAQSFSQMKRDYNQVGIVAHVNVTSVKFAADDIHPLYVVRCEIIEPFKGKIKRGQQVEFYFHAEEGYDVNRYVKEWIVFLEGKAPIPPGGKGWFELENSSLPPSEKNIARMRKIKTMRTAN